MLEKSPLSSAAGKHHNLTWASLTFQLTRNYFISVLFQPPLQQDEDDEQWFTLMQDNPVNSSKDESKLPEFKFLPNKATSHSNEPKVSMVNLN